MIPNSEVSENKHEKVISTQVHFSMQTCFNHVFKLVAQDIERRLIFQEVSWGFGMLYFLEGK
jgi:hypothetical protein